MKKFALSVFTALSILPASAFAQVIGNINLQSGPQFNPNYITGVVNAGKSWLQQALVVIMVLMTLWFLINVFRYIAEKDPGKLAEKRKVMLNGLIGLFVAVSVWGIVRIAGNILGTQGNSQPVDTICPPGMHSSGGVCING